MAFSFCGGVMIGYAYLNFPRPNIQPVLSLALLALLFSIATGLTHSIIKMPELLWVSSDCGSLCGYIYKILRQEQIDKFLELLRIDLLQHIPVSQYIYSFRSASAD